MAQKSELQLTPEQQSRLDAIINALHSGETITEDDSVFVAELEKARESALLEVNQSIIDAAVNDGRRVEGTRTDWGDITEVAWTEYIPAPSGILGDALIRQGFDRIESGVFGDEVTRTVRYWEPGNMWPVGTIISVISGGEERITGIHGFGAGGEYAGLKVGDTRPSPVPSNSAAGVRPSSWDPGNGNFGFASGGSNPTGGSNQTHSDNTSPGTQSQSDSSDAAGLGSPGMGRSDGVDPTRESAGADAGQGNQGGSDGGDPMRDTVDPDPGTEDQGGGDDQGDPSSAQTNDQPPAAEPAQQSGSSSDDIEFEAVGVGTDAFEHVENVNTGQVGAEAGSDIVTPQGYMAPVEGHWEDSDERTTDDGYSYTGEPPPAQQGQGDRGETSDTRSGGGGGGGQREMSWEEAQAHIAATWTDPNWNPEGAPIDYGDAADPNYDPVIPTSDEMAKPDEVTPLILVDPSFYEESTTGPTTELEMVGALENTGNPLEENQSLAPGGGMPSTSEQEYTGGNGLAATNPEMAGSVGEQDPNQQGLGALGSDDDLSP